MTKKQIYKKCLSLAKDIAKLRDNYTCQWCGSKKSIQASHIIPESASHRLAIDPYNIKALCHHCHLNVRHKNPNLASEWFRKKFPGRWESLQEKYISYLSLGSISMVRYEEQLENLTNQHKQLLKKKKKSL